MQEPEHVHTDEAPDATVETFDPQAALQAYEEARAEQASYERRERLTRVILGRFAAFGRFAFASKGPRAPRHADTWKDKGPHESTGAAARRLRQMERRAKLEF